MKYAVIASLLALTSNAIAATIKVPIHFFEALSPKDTTASARFQKEYETAIRTGKVIAQPRLAECGYTFDEKTVFYSASDPLEALERGKSSQESKAWLIVGPRRSNHYTLLAKGASETPSVSTMASSQEVADLAPLHLSIAPTNRTMAKAAAIEAKKRIQKRKLTYVAIVSEDCLSCVDFAEHFKAAASLGYERLTEFKIQGDSPDFTDIVKKTRSLRPSIVLLPNYSKVTAQAIGAMQRSYPQAFYVGGDGWGDSRFGFVQTADGLDGSTGITTRGFPSIELGLKQFRLGKDLLTSNDSSASKPGSASAMALLRIIDGATDILCKYRPKTREEFKQSFLKAGPAAFHSPWGVSVYRLKNGDISFEKIVQVSE